MTSGSPALPHQITPSCVGSPSPGPSQKYVNFPSLVPPAPGPPFHAPWAYAGKSARRKWVQAFLSLIRSLVQRNSSFPYVGPCGDSLLSPSFNRQSIQFTLLITVS